MIEGHGDDLYKYGKKIVSNFSSNVYNRIFQLCRGQPLASMRTHAGYIGTK